MVAVVEADSEDLPRPRSRRTETSAVNYLTQGGVEVGSSHPRGRLRPLFVDVEQIGTEPAQLDVAMSTHRSW